MKRSSAAVILLVFATGCVSRSELDRANQEILVLRAQVSQLQRDLADATARLSAAETAAARKPPLPVRLSFRRAVTDPSFVAVFETVLKTNLPVLVTWKSKASHAIARARRRSYLARPRQPAGAAVGLRRLGFRGAGT
jgi:outer membrane murein-binding lipoprotein Lpp